MLYRYATGASPSSSRTASTCRSSGSAPGRDGTGTALCVYTQMSHHASERTAGNEAWQHCTFLNVILQSKHQLMTVSWSPCNQSDNPRECNYHTHPTRCVLNPSAPTMLPRRKAPLLRWSARVFRRPWKRRRGSPRRTRTAATRRRITRTISCTGRSSRRTSTGQW